MIDNEDFFGYNKILIGLLKGAHVKCEIGLSRYSGSVLSHGYLHSPARTRNRKEHSHPPVKRGATRPAPVCFAPEGLQTFGGNLL